MTTSLNTAELPQASPLDVAALAQLANALFRATPGPAQPGPLEWREQVPTAVPVTSSAQPSLPATPGPTPFAPPSHPSAPTQPPFGQPNLPLTQAPVQSSQGGVPSAPGSLSTALPHEPSLPGSLPFAVPLAPGDAELRAILNSLRAPAPEQPQLARPAPVTGLDVNLVRRDFPILREQVDGRQLVWLDNAATTQKPQAVIDRLAYFYAHENSNIHRAAHTLAARATDAYEAAREKSRAFLHARSANEIIFVRGATEGINLIAQSWGRQHIGAGDEILISHLEHHANIVPWQRLVAEKGAKLRVIPVDESGQLRLDEVPALLSSRTKIVSITQVSNALGTVTPVQEVIALAHGVGARVLVDGAQAVSHMPVDVVALDADWYVFSGHKVFGPTGIGVVYGKENLLNATDPWQAGGNMIADVTFEHTVYQNAPSRFEAGTGNIADAVGLGAALDYITHLGMPAIAAYEHGLLEYGTWLLQSIPGLRLVGTAAHKASVLSFVLDGHKTEDVGAALSREGIAVRSGHHCAQPILRRYGLEATVRPSLAFYNTCAELDQLAVAVRRLVGNRSRVSLPDWNGFVR